MARFVKIDDEDSAVRDREAGSDRPVIINERRGGWGWLATLLTLALIAVILWATGVLDIDTFGSSGGDSARGRIDVQLNEPDNLDINRNNR